MTKDEYNVLFHKLELNRVAFKRLMDCDEEVLSLVNHAIKAEQDRIIALLKGIDEDECHSPDGWWETSTGVEFGEGILKAIRGETK
jgi:hypothetical protein